MIIDRDVAELQSDAALVGVTGAISRHAVADFPEARQLLDVDVDDLTGGCAFVTRSRRLLRLERTSAVQSARSSCQSEFRA